MNSVLLREADDTFQGGDVAHAGRDVVPPETKLFRAVLTQAWLDAFVHGAWTLTDGKTRSGIQREDAADIERKRARRFLTFNHGHWRDANPKVENM